MKVRHWIGLLFFGAIWGVYELWAGGQFYEVDLSMGPVWLSVWAFCVMALARGIWNARGSSTGIAMVAAGVKALGVQSYFCHLLAIVLLGVAFDLTAAFLLKPGKNTAPRAALAGVIAAYGGHALFAVLAGLLFRNASWLARGRVDVSEHILITGSLVALVGLFVVPLGFFVGMRIRALSLKKGVLTNRSTG